VRDIDWNVTARYGHPYVKVFSEERELTVILAVDLSGSTLFGTRRRFKRELAAEVAGLLAFVAIRTNDKVGAVLFGRDVDRFIPPKKGAGHVWRLIREIFAHQASPGVTDLATPLDYINRVVRRHAIVFLVSDFLVPAFDDRLARALSLTSRKHDLTAVRVTDPAERRLPGTGLIHVQDPETGQILAVDTKDKKLRRWWEQTMADRDTRLGHLLGRSGVDVVNVTTDGSVVRPLTAYFRMREMRR
jgi:uncharacterized protein (DUF58 family)